MQFEANAKINLGLFIKSKRPDGYHEIESLFLPINWSDRIKFEESSELKLSSRGIEIPPDPNGNLILRAYHLLKNRFSLPPLDITLEKNIPIGAGLGGGSADGAEMLKTLNQHFSLGLSISELENFALELGSDCPFFIQNSPAISEGRGEIFDREFQFELKDHCLIVVPPLHVSTATAYSLISPKGNRSPIKELIQLPKEHWQDELINDFEEPICKAFPLLEELRLELRSSGAYFVSMSGSGAAFYAIYKGEIPAISFPDDYQKFSFQLT